MTLLRYEESCDHPGGSDKDKVIRRENGVAHGGGDRVFWQSRKRGRGNLRMMMNIRKYLTQYQHENVVLT